MKLAHDPGDEVERLAVVIDEVRVVSREIGGVDEGEGRANSRITHFGAP
jgi:hypothetical protein